MDTETPDELSLALFDAAKSCDIEKTKSLLAAGADANAKDELWLNTTPLMYAAGNGSAHAAEAVKLLISAGADVNTKNDKDGETPLMRVAVGRSSSAVEAVKSLLAAGAQVDAKNIYGWSALMFAAEKEKSEIVKLLLDAGADERELKIVKFLKAAKSGDVETIKLLLADGMDVNAKGSWGETALTYAATSYSDSAPETVKLLLDAGAEVNIKNGDGETALLCASERGGLTESVKLLIAAGADVKTEDINGDTALDFASWHNRDSILDLLLKAGAAESQGAG